MIKKIIVDQSVETIANEMETKAKNYGFGLLKAYEFNSLLEEKGFPIKREIAVFELCNPPGAQAALDNYPEISVYLPCRISVYEEEGKTILSTIGLDEIVSNSDVLTDDFKKSMDEIYNRLLTLMSDW